MNLINLERVARDLGISVEELNTHLAEAIDAGLLHVADADDNTVTLQGVIPDEDDQCPPVLDARPSDDGRLLLVACPCGAEHVHGRHRNGEDCRARIDNRRPCTCPPGTGDGHRVAHCSASGSPVRESGYYLREQP